MDFSAPHQRIAVDLSEPTPLVLGVYFRSVFGPPKGETLLACALSTLSKRADATLAAAIREKLTANEIRVEILERDAMPLPARELLEYFHDGADEVERVQQSTHVAVVSALNDRRTPHTALWGALAVAEAAAQELKGVVFDPQMNHCRAIKHYNSQFPPNGAIRIIDHVSVVHSMNEDGQSWITTMGMTSLGLPNLEMRGVPQNLAANFGAVIAGVGQRIVDLLNTQFQSADAPQILHVPMNWQVTLSDLARASDESVAEAAGAGSTANVKIGWSEAEDGEEEFEPMLSILPADSYFTNREQPGTGYYQFLHDLLGGAAEQANLRNENANDPAMQQARAQAKAELPEVKERYQKGLPPGTQFYIKMGFEYSEGQEFMWVSVDRWNGNVISGAIANEPVHRKDLKPGTRVECAESDIDDWLIAHADGNLEGAYTTR